MFKKLTIENFRGIERLEVDDFKKINLIVGKNNCGKTAILDAIYIISVPQNVELILRTNSFRGLQIITDNILRSYFYNFISDRKIRICVEKPEKLGIRDLHISVHIADAGTKEPGPVFQDSSAHIRQIVNGLNYQLVITKKKQKTYHIQWTCIYIRCQAPKNRSTL